MKKTIFALAFAALSIQAATAASDLAPTQPNAGLSISAQEAKLLLDQAAFRAARQDIEVRRQKARADDQAADAKVKADILAKDTAGAKADLAARDAARVKWSDDSQRAASNLALLSAVVKSDESALAAARAKVQKPSEPVKHDPSKPEPVKHDPAKPEPVKHDPATPEPAKPEPVKHDPATPATPGTGTTVGTAPSPSHPATPSTGTNAGTEPNHPAIPGRTGRK